MTKKRLLDRPGIVRHTMRKDLLYFFLPFLTVLVLGLSFCGSHGDGLAGIWRTVWEVIKHPSGLLALPSHRSVGLSLFVIGLTIMIVSQATLWRNYSSFVVIKKDHKLITHGLYRFTRNPIYFGAIMVFAGLPAYAASLYGFLVMLTMVPILLFRIKMEEEILSDHFGEEFDAYRKRTKRLIPFVY